MFLKDLMISPSWEPKVGLPVHFVERNAAFGRQTVECIIDIFCSNPLPQRKCVAFNDGGACVAPASVVYRNNKANPKSKLEVSQGSYFVTCLKTVLDYPVRHLCIPPFTPPPRHLSAGAEGVSAAQEWTGPGGGFGGTVF